MCYFCNGHHAIHDCVKLREAKRISMAAQLEDDQYSWCLTEETGNAGSTCSCYTNAALYVASGAADLTSASPLLSDSENEELVVELSDEPPSLLSSSSDDESNSENEELMAELSDEPPPPVLRYGEAKTLPMPPLVNVTMNSDSDDDIPLNVLFGRAPLESEVVQVTIDLSLSSGKQAVSSSDSDSDSGSDEQSHSVILQYAVYTGFTVVRVNRDSFESRSSGK